MFFWNSLASEPRFSRLLPGVLTPPFKYIRGILQTLLTNKFDELYKMDKFLERDKLPKSNKIKEKHE